MLNCPQFLSCLSLKKLTSSSLQIASPLQETVLVDHVFVSKIKQ